MIQNFINLLTLSVCDNIMILKTLLFIKTLLNIVLLLVPIFLILMTTLDFAKNVIASQEDEMKKNVNLVLKRLIYAVAIFLIPTFVEVAINGIGNFNVEYEECFNITQAEIENKIAEQKASCVGDNHEWNDSSYTCEEIETYSETNNNKIYVHNYTISSNSVGNNIVFYNQCDTKWKNQSYCSGNSNICNSGCGAAALAIVATSLVNEKYDPAYVGKWMCENKIGTYTGIYGTDQVDLRSDNVSQHFNLNIEILFENGRSSIYSEDKGNQILTAVQAGKLVILNIPNHYVVIGTNEKCKNNQVYMYNVGIETTNGCYTPKELYDSTFNYNNRCKGEGICGWNAAYAYNKK